jgi:type I restriction enzyme S subunit
VISRNSFNGAFSIRRLGEVVEFLDSQRRPVTESDRRAGPYPYYGANGQQGTVDDFIFDEPLVLLAEDGGHFGEPDRGIAYRIAGKTWVNNHAHVLRPTSMVDIGYLCRVLENYDVRPFVTGTTRGKLTKASASEIPIPVPPMAEQRRIAEVLDRAEALRAKRRAALAQLDTLTQSLFLDLFGDPATNSNGLTKEILEHLTLNITDGKHGDCRPSPDSGYFFVSVKDIKQGQIDYSEARQIDRDDFMEVHRRTRLEVGDVLITNSGTIGKTALVAESPELARTTFQKSVAIVKPRRERLESTYLKAALDMCVAKLSSQSSGSSQKNLLLGQLRNFSVCVPPIPLQREFARRVSAVEKLKAAQRASLAELGALFATLQHRAFKGEL